MTPLARAASRLPGVRYGAVDRHADARGSFRELWRASAHPTDEPYVQANLSTSTTGVLRGLHLHRLQADRWVVLDGQAFVALVDVRPMLLPADAAPAPLVEVRELGPDDWVEIPAGVAHGFLALEPLDLVYLVTNEYDGSDELGFAWDDPLAGVPWPVIAGTPDGRPVLSQRDSTNPSLEALVAGLRTGS